MRFHWTLSSIPEIAAVPKSERRALWWAAQKRAGWSGRLAFGILASMLCLVPPMFYATDLAKACGFGTVGQTVFFFTTFFLAYQIGDQFVIWAVRPYLRQIIGTLCLTCGHDLRPSFSPCPHCGTIPANVITAPPDTTGMILPQ